MSKGRISLGAVALLALTACQPAGQDRVVDTAADEAAVRQVAEELYRHLEAGNYDAAAELYSEDALIIAPGAPAVDKQTLFAGLRQSGPPVPPNTAMKWTIDTREVVVSGDLAYERGSYSTTLVDESTGEPVAGAQTSPAILFVHMFRREADNRWKAWRYHPSPDVASPPPAPPAQPAE